MKALGRDTLVSLGTLCAAIGITVGVVRAFASQSTKIDTLEVRLSAMTGAIETARAHQERTDERFLLILQDLAAIKERLGIERDKRSSK